MAEVCGPAALAQKVERFGETSGALTDRLSASNEAADKWQLAAYAERITAKSGELSKAASAMPTDAERTERLCHGYDDLQAIVDEAASAVRGLPADGDPRDAPG